MSKSKLLIAAAIALGGTLATGAAQAGHRDDVQWSVTIGSPVGVPVYQAPTVVHTQPVYVHPQPVYVHPQHRHYRHPTRWDRDGDGIPNRHDRRYNPAWDRDGDGIPNRHDRNDRRYHPTSWDRDGDGVPNNRDWDVDGDGVPNNRDYNDGWGDDPRRVYRHR